MKNFLKIILVLIIAAGIGYLFIYESKENKDIDQNDNYRLLINGDNIMYKYEPFIQNDTVYIPLDTINKIFDNYLFYDENSNKVIYTDYNKVVKYKIGENKKTVNLKDAETKYPVLYKNNQVYIPVAEFKDYDLNIRYDVNNKMITIDDPSFEKSKIKSRSVSVYTKMDLSSKVLGKLKYDDIVYIYEDKLNHPRWLKVSTEQGYFGYIPKIEYEKIKNNNIANKETQDTKQEVEEKVVMFWQQGNNLNVLGNKINGVNTVSPDWFDIQDSDGNFKDKLDSAYLAKARENGYKVWPMFSNVNTKNATAIVSELVNSEAKRESAIRNILEIVEKYKLDGVNIDFEVMKESEKQLFTQFIRELAPILREKGVKVSVDIYFVNYIERSEIGKAADYVVLMAYDQHWSGSSNSGSVAELSWVENNLNSLLKDSKIPSNKIILGVPFYSKLWKETNGNSKITSSNLSLEGAQNFIKTNSITIVEDEKSGQHYGEKTVGNNTYKIWLEDEYSMAKRANLVKKYNLAGISAWQKYFDTEEIWNSIVTNIK